MITAEQKFRLSDFAHYMNQVIPIAYERVASVGGLNGVARFYLSDDPDANKEPEKPAAPAAPVESAPHPPLFLIHSLTTERQHEDQDFYRSATSVLLRNNKGLDLGMYYRKEHPMLGLETVLEFRQVKGPWRRTFRFIGMASAELDIIDPVRILASPREVILGARYWITARGECLLRRITVASEALSTICQIDDGGKPLRPSLFTADWLPVQQSDGSWLVGTQPIPPSVDYRTIWSDLVEKTALNEALGHLGFQPLPELG